MRQARLPRFLNRFGPKQHKVWQYVLCWLAGATYRLSWRRAQRFMKEMFGVQLHWTSWQRAIAKWPPWVRHALARASASGEACEIAAIDGTTFSRASPSEHYLHRIDRVGTTARPVQTVVMVDVSRRKFLAWRYRSVPRGEKCDVPYLIAHSPVRPDLTLMDKGFDSEPLHTFLRKEGVWSIAPVRKRCMEGRFRKQLRDCFDWQLYWQRNIIESLFSAIKRLFGTHVRARTARGQCAELYARFIAYNIGALNHDLLHSRWVD